MNSALVLHRSFTLRSAHLLLLLPILPYLGSLSPIDAVYREGSGAAALLLLILGAAMAFALTHGLATVHSRVRKEAEQLRPAWLTAVFAAQVPLLFTDDVMFFVASCAFLAAIPFGAEFQQRTLPSLLSLPLPRRDLWHSKMGVLAVALLVHWGLFLLAREAIGRSTSPRLIVDLLLAAAVAWATTPWWNLVLRGLLAGLVFSLALPALAFSLLFGTADALITWDRFADPSRAAWLWELFVLYALIPAYGIIVLRAAQRRWARLESPDAPGNDAGLAIVGASFIPRSRSDSPFRNLALKELRLQSVTWIAATIALFLIVWSACAEHFHWHAASQEFARAAATLGTFLTILLAGSIPLAEERQLGTLETLALQPSKTLPVWLLKVGLAQLLALGTLLVALGLGLPTLSQDQSALHLSVVAATVCAGLFASSGSVNGLRALLSNVLLVALTVLGFVLAVAASKGWSHDLRRLQREAAENDPSSWIEAVRTLDAQGALTPGWTAALPDLTSMLTTATALAALAALALSWWNLRAPAQAVVRYRRQSITLITALLLSYALAAALDLHRDARAHRHALHLDALEHARWFETLPPAEQHYYRSKVGDSFLEAPQELAFMVWQSEPAGSANEFTAIVSMRLPLNAAQKAILVQRGNLPPHVREAMRLEAGLPLSPPPREFPKIIPPPNFLPNASLMRRYGLLSPDAAGLPSSAPVPPSPVPLTPPPDE